jgi:hypothetical protein
MAILFCVILFRQRRVVRSLHASVRDFQVTRNDEARSRLATLAKNKNWAIAASALTALASGHERRGELEQALESSERARDKIDATLRAAAAYDLLLPGIRTQRARILAALGREADAMGELGLLERGHPAYAFLEPARRSVHLIAAAKRGDYRAAAVIAQTREDELAVSLRDETLGELARFAAGEPFSRDRRERLRTEIDEQIELRQWLERACPSALGDLVRATA